MGRSAGEEGGTRLRMERTTSSAMRLPYTNTLCAPPTAEAAAAAGGSSMATATGLGIREGVRLWWEGRRARCLLPRGVCA